MITRFEIFESVKDMMTSYSRENMLKNIEKLTPKEKYKKIISKGGGDILPKEEVLSLIDRFYKEGDKIDAFMDLELIHILTKDEIKKYLSEITIEDRLDKIFEYQLEHFYTKKELTDILSQLVPNYQLLIGIRCKKPWIIKQAISNGADKNKGLSYAVSFNDINTAKLLLSKGANVNSIDYWTSSQARKSGYNEILDLVKSYR